MNLHLLFRLIQVGYCVLGYMTISANFPDMWWGLVLVLALCSSIVLTLGTFITLSFLFGFLLGLLRTTKTESSEEIVPDGEQVKIGNVSFTRGQNLTIIESSPETGKFGDVEFANWIKIEKLGKFTFDGLVGKTADGEYDMNTVPPGSLIIAPGLLYIPQQ